MVNNLADSPPEQKRGNYLTCKKYFYQVIRAMQSLNINNSISNSPFTPAPMFLYSWVTRMERLTCEERGSFLL